MHTLFNGSSTPGTTTVTWKYGTIESIEYDVLSTLPNQLLEYQDLLYMLTKIITPKLRYI